MKDAQYVIKVIDESMQAQNITLELITKLNALKELNKSRLENKDIGSLEKAKILKTQELLETNIPTLENLQKNSTSIVQKLTALIELRQSFTNR